MNLVARSIPSAPTTRGRGHHAICVSMLSLHQHRNPMHRPRAGPIAFLSSFQCLGDAIASGFISMTALIRVRPYQSSNPLQIVPGHRERAGPAGFHRVLSCCDAASPIRSPCRAAQTIRPSCVYQPELMIDETPPRRHPQQIPSVHGGGLYAKIVTSWPAGRASRCFVPKSTIRLAGLKSEPPTPHVHSAKIGMPSTLSAWPADAAPSAYIYLITLHQMRINHPSSIFPRVQRVRTL